MNYFKHILLNVILSFSTLLTFAQVGIGTETPATSAALDITSADKALLITRLVDTSVVTNPIDGMLIYDMSAKCIKFYEDGAWTDCVSFDNPVLTASDFSPNAEDSYWIYNVDSSSTDLPDMDFTSTDSLYVASTSNASYSLDANDGMGAEGSMNSILTSGSLSLTDTTLKYYGTLDLPLDIDLEQTPEITDLVLLDLEAANGAILSSVDGAFSDTIDLQGTAIPLNISYIFSTVKENLYDSKIVNGTTYTNVYEGTLRFNLSITGNIIVFGLSVNINIIEPQDILFIRYYYGAGTGLLRAESNQGFELAPEIIALISQSGGGFDLPASATVTGVEELSTYIPN